MSFFCKHTSVCIWLCILISTLSLDQVLGQQVVTMLTKEASHAQHLPNDRTTKATLRNILLEHIKQGYVFATYDTIRDEDDTISILLYKGSQFAWQFPEPWTAKSFDEYVAKLGNEGYPFASVTFDSLKISENEVTTLPRLVPGPKIVFDTLSISGTEKLSEKYMHALLGFKPGDFYQERKFDAIPQRLSFQSLVQLTGPPDVGFTNGRAIVYINAKDLRSDQVDFILGFLPEANGGSTVTGYLKLDLTNLFQSGKSLFLDWNRFSRESQSLDLRYGHPFLLGSRVSVGLDLSILRQDSLFTKRRFGLSLQVPVSSSVQVGLHLQTAASDILDNEPDIANGLDYRLTEYRPFFQIGYVREVIDFGRKFGLRFSAGLADKKFRRNTLIPDAVYDTLQFRTTNVQLDLMSQLQLPVSKRGALFSKFEIGILEGDQIVRNEYYRIGGLKSLRGFNENDFFATGFFKWQLEYRQYFAQQSFLLAFYDLAVLDQFDSSFTDTTLLNAFGGGMARATAFKI